MDKNKEDWKATHQQLKSNLVSIKVQIRNLREDEKVDGKEVTLNPEIARLLKAYVRSVRLRYTLVIIHLVFSELQEVYDSLEKTQSKNLFKRVLAARMDKETLMSHNHRIEEAFRRYSVKFPNMDIPSPNCLNVDLLTDFCRCQDRQDSK
jgi:hypothetical protein